MARKLTKNQTKQKLEQQTAPVGKVAIPKDGNGDGTGQGKDDNHTELEASTFKNAFKVGQGGFSAIRAMVERGEHPEDLLLRGNFPSKRTDGLILLIAFAHHIAKCREFGDKTAEEEAMNLQAGMPAVDNARMNQVERAIIGEKPRFDDQKNQTWGRRIQNAAWGNKDAERE